MTSRDFCYWLQGFFEIAEFSSISTVQTEIIKRHLAMVFIHEIDPSFPKDHQTTLDIAHTKTQTPLSEMKPRC